MVSRGFTLIELLVVITIIAILSTVGVVAFTGVQSSARDSKRKQDLRAISQALELYKQTTGRYPCTSGWVNSSSTSEFWLTDTGCGGTPVPFDSKYIKNMPSDPIKPNEGNGWTSGNRAYSYYSATYDTCYQAGRNYVLTTQLENANDQESFGSLIAANRPPKLPCKDGSILTLQSSSYIPSTFVLTSP
jgi:prepilin-type N-terminal cleavage/methylation domain-containing protein